MEFIQDMAKAMVDGIRFGFIIGHAQIVLRDRNLKEASQDDEFLIFLVDELKTVFNISKAQAEKAMVLAFEKEAKEHKQKED